MLTSKSPLSFHFFNRLVLTIAAAFLSVMVSAQGDAKSVDVNIKTDSGGSFLGSPWVWVVGIAVFILLLVALLRGGGRRSA